MDKEDARKQSLGELRRAVRRLVQVRLAEQASGAQTAQDRLMTLIAGIATANPDLTLRDIAAQLEAMRERPPAAASIGPPPPLNICSIRRDGSAWRPQLQRPTHEFPGPQR
jgi:hypothetical protein